MRWRSFTAVLCGFAAISAACSKQSGETPAAPARPQSGQPGPAGSGQPATAGAPAATQQPKASREAGSATYEQELKNAFLIGKVGAKIGAARLLAVTVDANGGKVSLRGTVASQAEKDDVEKAARSAEGVTALVSELKVVP